MTNRIKSALISVYYKNGLDAIVQELHRLGVTIYSTGGTQKFIEELSIPVIAVETLTGYPSILGGRVKTLHPKVFGGILGRRDFEQDQSEMKQYEIPPLDLIIVDLYPFEETVASGAGEEDIIEKIDIGGVSLIRAAAKNFKDTLIVSSQNDYSYLLDILKVGNGQSSIEQRRELCKRAFYTTAHYDGQIQQYFAKGDIHYMIESHSNPQVLRYGENPHQQGAFYGAIDTLFDQKNGKELSYNNLVDAEAALDLLHEFNDPAFVIIKHTNACGVAVRDNMLSAWKDALAGDPVSAFGGVIATNRPVDADVAKEIDTIFFEILIAPSFTAEALEIFKAKKNRIVLELKKYIPSTKQFKSLLNGVLAQDKDLVSETQSQLKTMTAREPNATEITDLLFANRLVKHAKSNTIVLAKNNQLLGLGCGQTSRVDALKHAIKKAQEFGFSLEGAVMASDAFFPFPDCVELAHEVGIQAVIQPGGSVKDELSIAYCDSQKMAMVFTGIRHFKH
jgi:phosphoribosylaminoimidazolecarboxamide formyltransferase/IMP cyclohydrolase